MVPHLINGLLPIAAIIFGIKQVKGQVHFIVKCAVCCT